MSHSSLSTLRAVGARVKNHLRAGVTIDTRSLALFRIAIALLAIADVISRARNFSFYYTDDGLVSQQIAERATPDTAFSFFFYVSDPTWIAVLFVIHVLVAIQLLVGYKTRVAMILTFLFVISLDHHNPFVLSYADVLYRIMLFWAIFLPLGDRYSLDAIHRDRDPRASFVGIASALAMIQLIFMYFLNGIHKFPSSLWRSGEAAILVMGIDEMTYFLGDFMREFPAALQVGGWLWFHILLASPLLLLLHGRMRVPMVCLYLGGHLSFAITVRIGAFAYVAIAALLLFVPRELWDDLWAVTSRTRLADHYAGLRGRCIQAGRAVPNPRLDHEHIMRARRATYTLTMYVIVIALVISLVTVLPHITILGQTDVPDDEHPDATLEEATQTQYIYTVAETFNIDQPEWSIFAGPGPRSVDRYYVFPAKAADGTTYDVFNERNMTWDRPGQELQEMHGAYRERFWMNSIRRTHFGGELNNELADHLCETWEEEHGVELTHINMYQVLERIEIDTIDDPEERPRDSRLISRHTCDEDYRVQYIEVPPDF